VALHLVFPRSPYAVLSPDLRWFPAAEELRSTAYEKLLPPLVAKLRDELMAPGQRGQRRFSRTLCVSDAVCSEHEKARAWRAPSDRNVAYAPFEALVDSTTRKTSFCSAVAFSITRL